MHRTAGHPWNCTSCSKRIEKGDLHFGPQCNDCGMPRYKRDHGGKTPEEFLCGQVQRMLATRAANRAKGLHKGSEHYRTPSEIEWRHAVGQLTKKAVRLGFLPVLNGTIPCADCQRRPAVCYDHRDYSQPLLVAPVCIACNASRHKGVMPKPQTFVAIKAKAA